MSKKNSNKKFLIAIAVAFMLPLSLYLIVNKLSKGKVKMPRYYVVDRVDSQVTNGNVMADTVFHHVAELSLTNQLGEKVSLNKDLKSKILVVDFIFTDCTESCPKLTKEMSFLQKGFKKDPKKENSLEDAVQFISITVLPERDSFPVLRKYADRYGANPDRWWFLTGDKKTIYNFARNELGVETGQGDGGADDFIHSEKLVLIDTFRNIRGYYNGLDENEVKKCADDIVLLTLERKHKK